MVQVITPVTLTKVQWHIYFILSIQVRMLSKYLVLLCIAFSTQIHCYITLTQINATTLLEVGRREGFKSV